MESPEDHIEAIQNPDLGVMGRSSDYYRIPWASEVGVEGHWVAPGDAAKGRCYRCPACGQTAQFKEATRGRRAHFAHLAGPNTCNDDNVHGIAQLILKEILDGARLGLVNVYVKERGKERVHIDPGTKVTIEERDANNRLRYDIAIWKDNAITAIFEVRYQHKVDSRKIRMMPRQWWEIKALELRRLAFNPGMARIRNSEQWGEDLILTGLGVSAFPGEPGESPGRSPIAPPISSRDLVRIQAGLSEYGLTVEAILECARHPGTKLYWRLKCGGTVHPTDPETNGAHFEVRMGKTSVLAVLVAGSDSFVRRVKGNHLDCFVQRPMIVVGRECLPRLWSGHRVLVNGYAELHDWKCTICLEEAEAVVRIKKEEEEARLRLLAEEREREREWEMQLLAVEEIRARGDYWISNLEIEIHHTLPWVIENLRDLVAREFEMRFMTGKEEYLSSIVQPRILELEGRAEHKWKGAMDALREKEAERQAFMTSLAGIGDWLEMALRLRTAAKDIVEIKDKLIERLNDVQLLPGFMGERWAEAGRGMIAKVESALREATDINMRTLALRDWYMAEVGALDGPVDLTPLLEEYESRWMAASLDIPEMGPCTEDERRKVQNLGRQILNNTSHKQCDKAWRKIASCLEMTKDLSYLPRSCEEIKGIINSWEAQWQRQFPAARSDYVDAMVEPIVRRAIKGIEAFEVNALAHAAPEEVIKIYSDQGECITEKVRQLLSVLKVADVHGAAIAPVLVAIRAAGDRLGRDVWRSVIWGFWCESWKKLQQRQYEDRWTRIDQSLIDEFISKCTTKGIRPQYWPDQITDAMRSRDRVSQRRAFISRARPSSDLLHGYVDQRPPDDYILA